MSQKMKKRRKTPSGNERKKGRKRKGIHDEVEYKGPNKNQDEAPKCLCPHPHKVVKSDFIIIQS